MEVVFTSHYTPKQRAAMLSRYAAVYDAIAAGQTVTEGRLDGRVLAGLAKQGFITTADPRQPTPLGTQWRAEYAGDVAPLATVTPRHARKRMPKPSTVARDLMAAGLVFVHPKLIDDLSPDELSLWIKAKRHERDGLTLAALAALLGEPLAHVRIRAERIVAKGYVVAVRTEDAA